MAGRPKANLELSEVQRQELERMVRAGTAEKRMVFRARLILECATGADNVQVAKLLTPGYSNCRATSDSTSSSGVINPKIPISLHPVRVNSAVDSAQCIVKLANLGLAQPHCVSQRWIDLTANSNGHFGHFSAICHN